MTGRAAKAQLLASTVIDGERGKAFRIIDLAGNAAKVTISDLHDGKAVIVRATLVTGVEHLTNKPK